MLSRALCGVFLAVMILGTAGCPAVVCGGMRMNTIAGSGTPAREERPIGSFSGIDLAGEGTLTVTLGERERLVIEADDNLLPYLEAEQHGTTLRLQTRRGVNLHPKSQIHYELTARSLDAVLLSGCGAIELPDLQGPRLGVAISGSGDLTTGELRVAGVRLDISGCGDAQLGAVRADRVETTISGSGKVHIRNGEVAQQTVAISGSGDYQAPALVSGEARVDVSGSGAATVQARDRLRTRISGSGSVRYGGTPTVEQTISGSGQVERL